MTATPAQQHEWQHRAAGVVGHLLDLAIADETNILPAADWTVASAGCKVTGRFTQPDSADRKAAFEAWAHALGAEVTAGARGLLGEVRLTGKACLAEDSTVSIVLSARVWEDRSDAEAGDY